MKRIFAPAVLLLASSLAWAVDLTVPDKVQGDVGTFIKVPATTTGTQVRWVALDRGLNVFPVELLKDSKTAVVTSNAAGTYRLLAYTSDKDGPSDPAICNVTVGDPVPPTPPTPPPPTDPLTVALQAAYTADRDADRAKSLTFLQGAYKSMAVLAASRTDLTTNGAFVDWMKSIVEAPVVGLPTTKLVSLRNAIKAELSNAWGATAAPLTAAAASAELAKIAAALAGVR